MIIAERRLRVTGMKPETPVPVLVHAPENQRNGWICRFSIGWPGAPAERWGSGYDAVQAVQIALQMIGSELYASEYHARGELVWLKPGAGYGFPVAAGIRDRLVGDDKVYF